MHYITPEQARGALYDITNENIPEEERNVAYFLLDEFITQTQHFVQTRNIMIPMLLQKREKG